MNIVNRAHHRQRDDEVIGRITKILDTEILRLNFQQTLDYLHGDLAKGLDDWYDKDTLGDITEIHALWLALSYVFSYERLWCPVYVEIDFLDVEQLIAHRCREVAENLLPFE